MRTLGRGVRAALIGQDTFSTASLRFRGRADVFLGPNALGHAMNSLWHAFRPGDDLHTDETYHSGQEDAPIWAACCWREGESPYRVDADGPYVVGADRRVHAKVYVVHNAGAVVTSQNNGHSMLIECAVALYGSDVADWFSEQVERLERAVGRGQALPRRGSR